MAIDMLFPTIRRKQMDDTNLKQDKQRFSEWRLHRKHRQPIPDNLWRLACNHISALGITRVARDFRLDIRKLRDKAIQAEIIPAKHRKQTTPQSTKAAFQEISLNNMFIPSISTHGLVLERPDGLRVRFEGSLPDPEYVGRLAACLVGR
jgi:hypothetical protein